MRIRLGGMTCLVVGGLGDCLGRVFYFVCNRRIITVVGVWYSFLGVLRDFEVEVEVV